MFWNRAKLQGPHPDSDDILSNGLPIDKTKRYTKHHDQRAQTRRLAKVLILIIFGNVILIGCLMGTLWGFGQAGELNKSNSPWLKRIFNVITITLTSLISIGIGTLFEQIGFMVRWPLLARQSYSLQEVDDILQLGNITGSARLLRDTPFTTIRRQLPRGRRAIILFLLTTTLGRLSISLFGVAYSVNDIPVVQVFPEIRTSVWPEVTNNSQNILDAVLSPAFNLNSNENVAFQKFQGVMSSFLLAGLNKSSVPPKVKDTNDSSAWDPMKNLQMTNMSLFVHEDTSVTYEYSMRNFQGDVPVASPRSLNSTTKCTRLKKIGYDNSGSAVFYDPTYANGNSNSRGRVISTANFAHFALETIGGPLPGGVVVSQETVVEVSIYYDNACNVVDGFIGYWIAGININGCGPRCVIHWVWAGNITDYETDEDSSVFEYVSKCETSLSQMGKGNQTLEEELLISDQRTSSILAAFAFSQHLSGSAEGCWAGSNLYSGILYNTTAPIETGAVYPTNEEWQNTTLFLRDFSNVMTFSPILPNSSVEESYEQPMFLFPPTLTPDSLKKEWPNIGINVNSSAMEIWTAALLARLPVALISFLDTSGLLEQTQIQPAETSATIQSTLQVEWGRAWAIFGVLVYLQLMAVVGTLWYCRNVIVRDNSTLVLAQTLKTVSEGFDYEVSSIADRKELARSFGEDEVQYGTVFTAGVPKVDIRRRGQVETKFPAGEYD